MKFELTENETQNLVAFLDRVQLTGHAERNEMNKICYKLANPIPEPMLEPTTEQTEEPPK